MSTYYTISKPSLGKNRVPKAAAGALIGTALQVGQTIGEMMPDNGVGDYLKQTFNPLSGIGSAVDHFSEGKIGRGFLSLTPIGAVIDGKERREAAAKAEEEAKKKANKTFFANRRILDSSEANMIADGVETKSLYANGGSINAAPTSLNFYGGNEASSYNGVSGVPIGNKAELITNPNGSVSGSHETGQNIPIIGDGKTQAIAEPGEVLVNKPDGTATVLSARLGYAQQYIKLQELEKQINEKLKNTLDVPEKNALQRQLAAIVIAKQKVVSEQDKVTAEQEAAGAQEQVPVASLGASLDNDPFAEDRLVWKNGKLVPARPRTEYFGKPNLRIGNPPINHLLPPRGFTESGFMVPRVNPFTEGNGLDIANPNPSISAVTPININPPVTSKQNKGGVKTGSTKPNVVSPRPPDIPVVNPLTPEVGKPALNSELRTENSDTFVPNVTSRGIDIGKGLGIASTVASMALPIVANYKNKKILDKMQAKLDEYQPSLMKVNRAPDKVSIADQVSMIDGTYGDNLRVSRSVANPLVGAALASQAGAVRIGNMNQVHGEANRINMTNAQHNARMATQASGINAQMMNEAGRYKLEGSLGRLASEINLNNQTVANIYSQLQELNMKDLDLQRMSLAMKYLNNNGIIDRNFEDYAWVQDVNDKYGLNIPTKK